MLKHQLLDREYVFMYGSDSRSVRFLLAFPSIYSWLLHKIHGQDLVLDMYILKNGASSSMWRRSFYVDTMFVVTPSFSTCIFILSRSSSQCGFCAFVVTELYQAILDKESFICQCRFVQQVMP